MYTMFATGIFFQQQH